MIPPSASPSGPDGRPVFDGPAEADRDARERDARVKAQVRLASIEFELPGLRRSLRRARALNAVLALALLLALGALLLR